jgi:uncharacterized membrane protein YGL010W
MRTAQAWLSEYGESHQHPTNEFLHFLCVPAIVLSVMGLLWSLPVPAAFARVSPWLNWASLAALAAFLYYLSLSVPLALGGGVALALLLLATAALAQLPLPLWVSSLAIFVVAWTGQFIGHAIEGKRPSFFKDVQFLLIGPLWLLASAYRRLRLAY